MDAVDVHRVKSFLRLHLVRGLGFRTANRLLLHFEGVAGVLASSVRELESLGVPPAIAGDLLSNHSRELADRELDRATSLGIDILDRDSAAYPRLLREIYDPPLVLYRRGTLRDLNLPQLAVVGTRRPTPYGLNCAERLSEDLSERGVVIVSGMARGIDTAAHRGALRKGPSIAIFGCSLDHLYPRQNRKLAEILENNGAHLSEFPLGTPPVPENFPVRNRIIAGATLGTLVVEAAEHSGSLITARCAVDSNREVFAVPGPISNRESVGPHLLIRQGARLVTGWMDVIEELPEEIRERALAPLFADHITAAGLQDASCLAPPLASVLRALSASVALGIDELHARAALDHGELYAALFELEASGLIRQLPGKKYLKRMP